MKIAIVVHGRFHAFDLAKALLARRHDVTVLTNYPVWATRRFGLPPGAVRSFPIHGALTRAVGAVHHEGFAKACEPLCHQLFGRWAAKTLGRETWDVIHCWSGVSEEILRSKSAQSALTLLMRGSSHIAAQRRLLDEESTRVAKPLDRPSDWMIARELREYGLAKRINVLSTFSLQTFEQHGTPRHRLSLLPLGVDVEAFKVPPLAAALRQHRLLANEPLRVLYVGALSFRKGLLDFATAADVLSGGNFHFTLVGQPMPETAELVAGLRGKVEILGKLPQAQLPPVYHASDVFLFPTIEDGFPTVLAQAKAAGLPIITTANGAGTDLVHPGVDGWIVPIRQPAEIIRLLDWCNANRVALADMSTSHHVPPSRDWSEVAADFERICEDRASEHLAMTPADVA